MKLYLRDADVRHEYLIRRIIQSHELDYDLQIRQNHEMKSGNMCVLFDYDVKHCGDSCDEKFPTSVFFNKILELMPNNHLKLEMLPSEKYKITIKKMEAF